MCFKGKSQKTPQNSGWGIAVIYPDCWWIALVILNYCTSIFLQSTLRWPPWWQWRGIAGRWNDRTLGIPGCAKWMECVLHWLILTPLFHLVNTCDLVAIVIIYIYNIALYWSYFREAFVSPLSSSPTLVELLLKADGCDSAVAGSRVHRALPMPVLQCVP